MIADTDPTDWRVENGHTEQGRVALVTIQRDELGGPQDTTLHTTHLRIRGPYGPAHHATELIDHPILTYATSPLLFLFMAVDVFIRFIRATIYMR